jgi:hypothetical protein
MAFCVRASATSAANADAVSQKGLTRARVTAIYEKCVSSVSTV